MIDHDAIMARFEARRAASEASRLDRIRSGLGADALSIATLPVIADTAVAALGLTAERMGALDRTPIGWRLNASDRAALLEDSLAGDDDRLLAAVVDAGRRLEHLTEPPLLRRWARLAAVADDRHAFTDRLMTEVRDGREPLRWVEAARHLEALLGGALRLVVLRAARTVELQDRRADDAAQLRYFVPPPDAEAAFEALWHGGKPGLHLRGDGGVGKTTFLRHLSRLVPDRGGVLARVDFDHLDPDYPERQPGLLLAMLAEELLLQAESEGAEGDLRSVGSLADRIREQLSGAGADAVDDAEVDEVQSAFVHAVEALTVPVVLVLDTCEELARQRADGSVGQAAQETLTRVGAVLERCSNARALFSGRWALPARDWLAVQEMRGFGRPEAEQYLGLRAVKAPALRAAMLASAAVDPEQTCFSPFELNWLAGWVEQDPALSPADLREAPVDRYVQTRVLGRVHSPDVKALLPAAALAGRFDDRLLAACVDLPAARFLPAFEALTRQEWVRRAEGFFRIEPRIAERMLVAFERPPRARVAEVLLTRILEDWPPPDFAARWLMLGGDRAGWDRIVRRVEQDRKWGWLADVPGLARLAGRPLEGLVALDGLAAEAWLGRTTPTGALQADEEGRLLALLRMAAVTGNGPALFVDDLRAASVEALTDRVIPGVLTVLQATLDAGVDGETARALLPAAARLVRGRWASLARVTLARLEWAAGRRESALDFLREAAEGEARIGVRLYLTGVLDRRVRVQLEAARLAWPALIAPDEIAGLLGGVRLTNQGPDDDRLASLLTMAQGPAPELVGAPTPLVLSNATRAHRGIPPLAVSRRREEGLARPAQIERHLRALGKMRVEVEQRTDHLDALLHIARTAAHLLIATRQPDARQFGAILQRSLRPADVRLAGTLDLFANGEDIPTDPAEDWFDHMFADTHRRIAEDPHLRWRFSIAPQAEPTWLLDAPPTPERVLDTYEAVRLGLLDSSLTLDLGVDPARPGRLIRLNLRARALGFPVDTTALDDAVRRLSPRLAARLALDEAEHLSLRLPQAARQIFAFAHAAFKEAGDGFGVTRAGVGAALAAMAIPDRDAAAAALADAAVDGDTPPAWTARALLVERWLQDRTALHEPAGLGTAPPLLPAIRAASAPSAKKVRVRWRDAQGEQSRTLPPGATTVGRAADNTIRLPSASVSRRHAQVDVTPEGVRVRDLDSAAGLILEGERTEESTWRPGEVLQVGDVEMQLDLDDEVAAGPPPPVDLVEPAPAVQRPVTGAFAPIDPAVRLRIDVRRPATKGRQVIDGPVEVTWSIGVDSVSFRLARPLADDPEVHASLRLAGEVLERSDPSFGRLQPSGDAAWYPWEALMGEGSWLPCVRAGGGRESLDLDLSKRLVVADDRADLRLGYTLWGGAEAVDWKTRQGGAHAPVLHLIATPIETFGRVVLSFESAAEQTVSGTRAVADFVDAAAILASGTPQLCVLQLPALREGMYSHAGRYLAALMRRFAADLGAAGAPWILVLPAVPEEVLRPVFERLQGLGDAADLAHHLVSAVSNADRGALRDACIIGPD